MRALALALLLAAPLAHAGGDFPDAEPPRPIPDVDPNPGRDPMGPLPGEPGGPAPDPDPGPGPERTPTDPDPGPSTEPIPPAPERPGFEGGEADRLPPRRLWP